MISIIVPVYNVENFIQQCIDSILRQTVKEFEVLLIDDGSQDLSGMICKEYEKKDKRVRYIRKKNGGVSSARNAGMHYAKGDYLVFVDSDDFIREEMLEHLINDSDPDFSMCGYELYDGLKKNVIKRCECPEFSGNVKDMAKIIKTYIDTPFLLGPCFKLYKKYIIEQHQIQFPLDLSYGEDAIFVFQYLLHCESIEISSYVGYSYRKYGSQTLSEKFLREKIDINYRINSLIEQLLKKENIKNRKQIVSERLLECFVSYEKELLQTTLGYKEKKKIFYEKYMIYKNLFGKPKRVAQRIIFLAGENRRYYLLIYLFKLKELRRTSNEISNACLWNKTRGNKNVSPGK